MIDPIAPNLIPDIIFLVREIPTDLQHHFSSAESALAPSTVYKSFVGLISLSGRHGKADTTPRGDYSRRDSAAMLISRSLSRTASLHNPGLCPNGCGTAFQCLTINSQPTQMLSHPYRSQ